ncbi:MAG TPA: hypothetical protein VL349_02415 [Terriglobales bacterium]|nr:hypothetical protein [Terriglobales bacterium]
MRRPLTGTSRSWIAVVAVIAAMGILIVLITPAPDELPSTGPHSLNKTFALTLTHFSPPVYEILGTLLLQFGFHPAVHRGNLLAFTCSRLC